MTIIELIEAASAVAYAALVAWFIARGRGIVSATQRKEAGK